MNQQQASDMQFVNVTFKGMNQHKEGTTKAGKQWTQYKFTTDQGNFYGFIPLPGKNGMELDQVHMGEMYSFMYADNEFQAMDGSVGHSKNLIGIYPPKSQPIQQPPVQVALHSVDQQREQIQQLADKINPPVQLVPTGQAMQNVQAGKQLSGNPLPSPEKVQQEQMLASLMEFSQVYCDQFDASHWSKEHYVVTYLLKHNMLDTNLIEQLKGAFNQYVAGKDKPQDTTQLQSL